jgi:hypothetical protein
MDFQHHRTNSILQNISSYIDSHWLIKRLLTLHGPAQHITFLKKNIYIQFPHFFTPTNRLNDKVINMQPHGDKYFQVHFKAHILSFRTRIL